MSDDIKSKYQKVKLNQKEQLIEIMVVSIAILLIGGCFLKVMFF